MTPVSMHEATFQDSLFSTERVVQRVLPGGTVLRLTLEPLAGERVRVLDYRRKRAGETWQIVREEAGRTLAFDQLGLPHTFIDLFGGTEGAETESRPAQRKKVRR